MEEDFMCIMTKEKTIELLDNLIGIVDDNHDNDYDEALKNAISYMEKIQKIEEVISNQDDLIIEIYGVCIPEGYADLFGKIEHILKE